MLFNSGKIKRDYRFYGSLARFLFSYFAVSAINGIVTGTGVPIITLRNSIPLRLCSVIVYARKSRAKLERPLANCGYAITYRNARKARAIIERQITY